MSFLTPAEFASDYGSTGTLTDDQLQMAIDLAELDVESYLNTFLTPTTVTKEFIWPQDREQKITLPHNRVTSITTVTAKHSLDQDCVWTEDAECGVILDGYHGIIQIHACNLSLASDCNCSRMSYLPDRAVVTYVAGFTDAEGDISTRTGKLLRQAIALRARAWFDAITDPSTWDGEYLIKSWNLMDYSERRDYGENIAGKLGPGPLSIAATRILKNFKVKTAIMLRSSGRF